MSALNEDNFFADILAPAVSAQAPVPAPAVAAPVVAAPVVEAPVVAVEPARALADPTPEPVAAPSPYAPAPVQAAPVYIPEVATEPAPVYDTPTPVSAPTAPAPHFALPAIPVHDDIVYGVAEYLIDFVRTLPLEGTTTPPELTESTLASVIYVLDALLNFEANEIFVNGTANAQRIVYDVPHPIPVNFTSIVDGEERPSEEIVQHFFHALTQAFPVKDAFTSASSNGSQYILTRPYQIPIDDKDGNPDPVSGRVNMTLPPLSAQTYLTFTRNPRTSMTLARIETEYQSCTKGMRELIEKSVEAGHVIALSGPSGVGKTTNASAIVREIPLTERVLCAEETQELTFPDGANVLRYNYAGMDGETSLSTIISNANLQRLQRIIIGEMNDKTGGGREFLAAAEAIPNGVIATLHAKTPVGAIERLVELCNVDDTTRLEWTRRAGKHVDLIIQLAKVPRGGGQKGCRYVIHSISYPSGTVFEDGRIGMATMYAWSEKEGRHIQTAQMPTALRERFEEKGVDVSRLEVSRSPDANR